MSERETTEPRWAKLCYTLWKILRFLWITLIPGMFIGTIANLFTITISTNATLSITLQQLFIVRFAQAFPIPVYFGLGILVLLTWLSWLGSRRKDITSVLAPFGQNRTHMLRRLHLRYKQMSTQSLQGAIQMELGFISRPASVHNAASLSWHLPDEQDQPLPFHASIIDAYELAQRELLILGEPGAGKSTLLLDLAHHLVEQAEHDNAQPLPILLSLSSWVTNSRHSLQDWLCEQVTQLYDVPRYLCKQWVQTEQLLFLLDGLDEVEASARPACITAINVYHHEHLQPLVVSSRANEYDVASSQEQLSLHAAVVVQPLSPEQVDDYLETLGKPLAALRAALKKNSVLAKLATTPLMLSVLMLTYRGILVRELSRKEDQLQRQIWHDYVERMISRKGDMKRYPSSLTITWLTWLAQKMRKHGQTFFRLSSHQEWLLEETKSLYYQCIVLGLVLIGIIFIVLIDAPSNALRFVLIGILSIGLGMVLSILFKQGSMLGFIGTILIILLSSIVINSTLSSALFGASFGVLNSVLDSVLGIVLSVAVLGALLGRVSWGMSLIVSLVAIILIILLSVITRGILLGTLFSALFSGPGIVLGIVLSIVVLGALLGRISWGISLIISLVAIILIILLSVITRDILLGALFGALLGPGIVLGTVLGIVALSRINKRLGIGLIVLISLLIGVSFVWVIYVQFSFPIVRISIGLGIGLIGMLIATLLSLLYFMIYLVISDYILRCWFHFTHTFPYDAKPFLEDATARILLRSISGERSIGYSFMHQLLLEYFADLSGNSPPTPST